MAGDGEGVRIVVGGVGDAAAGSRGPQFFSGDDFTSGSFHQRRAARKMVPCPLTMMVVAHRQV
jgi:hypothetical protein